MLLAVLQVAPSVTLKVEFRKMTQTNTTTGWQRDVRCIPTPSGDHTPSPTPQGQFEWQDEHGRWNSYSPAVQRLLEACRGCGVKKCEFEAMGRCYTVEGGKQTNMETGVQRAVRYQQGNTSNGTGEFVIVIRETVKKVNSFSRQWRRDKFQQKYSGTSK